MQDVSTARAAPAFLISPLLSQMLILFDCPFPVNKRACGSLWMFDLNVTRDNSVSHACFQASYSFDGWSLLLTCPAAREDALPPGGRDPQAPISWALWMLPASSSKISPLPSLRLPFWTRRNYSDHTLEKEDKNHFGAPYLPPNRED